jgi:cytosol alanyl aminopeptidase
MQPRGRLITATLVVVSTCGTFHLSYAGADESLAPPKLRLPADVVGPVRYRVELTAIPDQDTFTGAIDIDLQFAKATSVLWLNAEALTIKEATLTVGSEKSAANVITEPKDFVGFSFDHAVGPGPATLHVAYQGEISRKDFRGIFQMKDGDQWYIYSQFENIDARRAFPCFDEPGYKVPWQLTLNVKKDQVALSNTPIVSETDAGNGMKTVKFAETPPLPSYLVAMTVGNLELVDAGTAGKKNTRIRIVVPHGRTAEAKYAVETTPTIVNLLEGYFGIPYPYDKLDEVAIPLAGYAMEHPGLVTYGASLIIEKPDEDTPGRQRGRVSVASHELAHQWVGDLVTTAWWDDIWLNEGFASWMANKIVNQYHPEWNMNISELNGYQGAMDNDALVSARQVRQPIESDDDIANAFDSITYQKGSALLNMFESYMGPEKFRDGVRRYLLKYEWKNATSAEFLQALAGDDSSIVSSFSSFLDQPGVPLVTAQLECNGSAPQLGLSQQRFLPLGSTGTANQLWKVPVCVRYAAGAGDARECTLLDQKAAELPLSKASACPGWVEVNANADGYYRVLYPADLLGNLLKNDAEVLSLAEKVSLIGDVSALTGNGKIPLGKALALAPALAGDSHREAVTKTMDITTGLEDRYLVPEDMVPRYRQYLMDLYGGRAQSLGWKASPGETDDARLLRPQVLDVVANQAEDAEAIAEAKKLAAAWLDDHKAVAPDMVRVVLGTAARHGDRELFDRMRAAARQEKDENFREALLFRLGFFPDPEIVKIAMPIVLTDEFDSRQSLAIIGGVEQSPNTRDLAYAFVKQNWDALTAKLPTDMQADAPSIAVGYCDRAHRQDVEAFFKDRSTKFTGGPRILAQVLEGIDLCIAYKQEQAPSVAEFLKQYGSSQ